MMQEMSRVTHPATASVECSVVLPCLNEEKTVADCVAQALQTCRREGIHAEVIVADNGSQDRSRELAKAAGARVIDVPARGYGAALRAGIEAAQGPYVLMADSDASYDLSDIPKFLAELRRGADLVMGSRFRGTIHPGAMPFLHKYLGNPVLTWILNLFFRAGITDAYCGMRAFSRDAVRSLALRTSGMEFAIEMIIRASQQRLKIGEIPTNLRPDGRGRKSHLRTWRDGWRTLRFMLLFSPLWLFLVPGISFTVLGCLLMAAVAFMNVTVLGHRLNTHFALLGSMMAVIGLQIVSLAIFAKSLFVLDGYGSSPWIKRFIEGFHLELSLIVGLLVFLTGFAIDGWMLVTWLAHKAGELAPSVTHLAIVGGTLCLMGLQIIFSAFFLSILTASRTGRWI